MENQAAGILFRTVGKRILFLKRSDTGEWNFPGGTREDGESIEECARREALEEIGPTFPNGNLVPLDHCPSPVDFTTFYQEVPYMFVPSLNEEHTEYCWASIAALPDPLHPGVLKTLGRSLLGDSDKTARHRELENRHLGITAPPLTPEEDAEYCRLTVELSKESRYHTFESVEHVLRADAWSEAAREASIAARRAHKKMQPETELRRTNFEELLEKIKAAGGMTYNVVDGSAPKPGDNAFVLSPYKDREKVLSADKLTPNDLFEYVVDNYDKLSSKGHYFGSWLNPEDGKIYLDTSIVVNNEKRARDLCKKHKQLAYFSMKTMDTVSVSQETKDGQEDTDVFDFGADGPDDIRAEYFEAVSEPNGARSDSGGDQGLAEVDEDAFGADAWTAEAREAALEARRRNAEHLSQPESMAERWARQAREQQKRKTGGGSVDELRQRVVVAYKLFNGELITGKPGDLHEDLYQRRGKQSGDLASTRGFYDPLKRKFYSREDLPFDATDLPAYAARSRMMRAKYDKNDIEDTYEESKHPRAGKGSTSGGQFVGKGPPKRAFGSKRPEPVYNNAPLDKNWSEHFGSGYWFNIQTEKLIPMDPSELGPHGDHDGWMALSDHAEQLGINKRSAAAFQVAVWGPEILPPSSPYIKPFIDPKTNEPYEWANFDNYRDNATFDKVFKQTFAVSSEQAETLSSYLHHLIRIRKWKNRILTFDIPDTRFTIPSAILDKLGTEELMSGVDRVVVGNNDGSVNLTIGEFLRGGWKIEPWNTKPSLANFRGEDSGASVTVTIPLLIRLLEWAREDVKADVPLHILAERAAYAFGTLGIEDYDDLTKGIALSKDGYDELRAAAILRDAFEGVS